MLAYPNAIEFKKAADKEFNTLYAKNTFEYIEQTDIEQTDFKKTDKKILPLMWIFKYKFDTDGCLIKYKARLCARGDLQIINLETYAATLAA